MSESGRLVVPDELAGAVFRAVIRDATERVRRDGGELSPGVRRLLFDLHQAADGAAGSAPETVPVVAPTMGSLTVTEAAVLLECSTVWVRRLCRQGRIQARATAAGWLIDPTSLHQYRTGRTAA